MVQKIQITLFFDRPIINTKDAVKKAQMEAYIKQKFGKDYITPADLFYERLNQKNNKDFDPWRMEGIIDRIN